MFGIKTHIFPDKGSSSPAVKFRLWQVKRQLQKRDVARNLGWLYTLPHPVAVNAYKYFLDQNPNHLGNWTTKESRPFATQELEREVIWKMIDLYHADKNQVEGYITSGGTESNIFSTWVGRKYLEQYTEKSKICLIKTSLTHYSIRKSADIAGIPDYLSPLNPEEWNLDQHGLAETVTKLYEEGYRGFLLPLTLGYTQTGTCDNVEDTTKTVERLQKELKDAHFFLWIDAALHGLITPFIAHFQPFHSPLIQAMIVDFHKFGQVPYPAGIVLYRKELQKLIERPIEYLPETDATLLGSRSGAPAAAIWSIIHLLGFAGFATLVKRQLANKTVFIERLRQAFPDTEIVTHQHSLSCGIIFRFLKNNKLPSFCEKKYGLFSKETSVLFAPSTVKKQRIYKFYFLPHVTKKVVDEAISDIRQAYDAYDTSTNF